MEYLIKGVTQSTGPDDPAEQMAIKAVMEWVGEDGFVEPAAINAHTLYVTQLVLVTVLDQTHVGEESLQYEQHSFIVSVHAEDQRFRVRRLGSHGVDAMLYLDWQDGDAISKL